MNTQYKGMRWLKCDLQVQTPEDSKHWLDEDLRLLDPRRPKVNGSPSEEDIQEKARLFLRRCHELELDVIGLTDHNFSSKTDPREWFSVHLVEQNKRVAKECNRNPISFLPGFEVDIGYHVLCLFGPAKKQRDFEQCNRVLTTLGLPEERRFDRGVPNLLQHDGQRLTLKKLLDIVQGEYGGIVVAAHSDQASGIFESSTNKEDYSHPGLLALEVTGNPPADKYLDILSGKNVHWQREGSHPAFIMSSDAKSLKHDNGVARENSLGYRYTWMKMSNPSIASLRQAFLDHQSRIKLPENTVGEIHPDERSKHAKITSISIKNVAFLGDQDICLSSSLNCVIGGRGSGKSTVLEYLRIIFGKDRSEDIDESTKIRIDRARDTLNSPGAELEVCWVSADGVEDRVIWKGGEPAVQREDMHDLETFFQNLPIRFFSQQQLNRLTESTISEYGQAPQAQRLLKLIDGFAKHELDELASEEKKTRQRIHASFSNLRSAKGLERDLKRAQQEYQDLELQWKARSEIQDDAIKHQKLKGESNYLESLFGEPGNQFSDVVDFAEAVASSHKSFEIESSPHESSIKQLDKNVEKAKYDLAAHIRKAVDQYHAHIRSLKESDPAWEEIQKDIEQADVNFSEACALKGLTPNDVGRLKEVDEARVYKNKEISGLEAEIKRLKEEAGDVKALGKKLHQLWQSQFQQRVGAARDANALSVLNEERRKFIEVSVSYQCDQTSFSELWGKFGPTDGRKSLAKNWNEIGNALLEKFQETPGLSSPWALLRSLYSESGGEKAEEVFGNQAESLKQHIMENPESWDQLRTSRVKDVVDLKLFRPDGTLAGSISEGSLSDGQRNTAALALLLAQKGGPLVIDQPEDELDSNFVFKELIPMLRKVKDGRQIILATHNANLPVNGDAELVYALEAKGGEGILRAQGGLDQPEVTEAVLDIMEGTEEAFRRRREKYHF